MPEFLMSAERLNALTETVAASTAAQLGINQTDFTPDMTSAVQASIQKSFEQRFLDQVGAVSDKHVSLELGAVSVQESVKSKLGNFAGIATAVLEDAKYTELLEKNASMMRQKFTALTTAGFTEEQAFRLIEAEVYAKSSARASR
jgi:hypothetical protein